MSEASEALGQRLKAERDRKGLSCQKAADELHLDGWVIEELESGDYARLGPAVYAKGHLKRYAELLGLPVEEILASFSSESSYVAPPPQSAHLRMRTSAPIGSKLPWAWIGGTVGVLLTIAGIWWWHPWHPRVPSSSVAAVSKPAPASPSDVAPSAPAPVPAAAPPAPTATPPEASGVGRTRLRLTFLADSRVDVRDAAGQRLYAGLGHVHNVRTLAGEGPLRVYIQSASSVHVDLNNKSVVIGPQFIVNDAAHFQAGADGVVRRDPLNTPPAVPAAAGARPR
jgi:cytoskeleton protein RodZ